MDERTRLRVGFMLRLLQNGESIPMPHSKPMPQIDSRCHELRVKERDTAWRVIYSLEPEAVVVLATFKKMNQTTPERIKRQAMTGLKRWRTRRSPGEQTS